jgi:hypothetical protein
MGLLGMDMEKRAAIGVLVGLACFFFTALSCALKTDLIVDDRTLRVAKVTHVKRGVLNPFDPHGLWNWSVWEYLDLEMRTGEIVRVEVVPKTSAVGRRIMVEESDNKLILTMDARTVLSTPIPLQ